MSQLVNLTPHPMHLYPVGTPDRVDPATVTAIAVIPPSPEHRTVRFGQRDLGPDPADIGYPVHRVALGVSDTDNTVLPEPCTDTWYIVSTLVALAHPDRADLLMPYGTIRDLDGSTIGATGFARAARPDGDHR
ncbi:hypothetical protein [Actinoplanes sp. NPDC049599]|uniref:hypothetical protein n=1 Tax=Actinoplanes sp. NPDC049599 TaxID=3363903 RepID=UPI00379FE10C